MDKTNDAVILLFVSTVEDLRESFGTAHSCLFTEAAEILKESSDVLQQDLEGVDEHLLQRSLLPSETKTKGVIQTTQLAQMLADQDSPEKLHADKVDGVADVDEEHVDQGRRVVDS